MAVPILDIITAAANMGTDAFNGVSGYINNKSLERQRRQLGDYWNIANGRASEAWMDQMRNRNNYYAIGGAFEVSSPFENVDLNGGSSFVANPYSDAQFYNSTDQVEPSNFNPSQKAPDQNQITNTGGGIGGLVAAVRGLDTAAGSAIGNNYHSGVGDVVSKIPLMSTLGGAINRVAGEKTNQSELYRKDQEEGYLANLSSMASVASSFDDKSLNGPYGVNTHVNPYKANSKADSIGFSFLTAGPLAAVGAGILNRRARRNAERKNKELTDQLTHSFNFAQRASANAIDNIKNKQFNDIMSNYHAFGGPLDYDYSMTHLNMMRDALPTPPPGIFAFGGDTQMNVVENGGRHEENPMGGVPVNVGPNGNYNMVEEGEVVVDGFVFSDRIQLPNSLCKKYHVKKGATIADAAKKVNEESEQRPNDPITKTGTQAELQELAETQETIKNLQGAAGNQAQAEQDAINTFAFGGSLPVETPYGFRQKYGFGPYDDYIQSLSFQNPSPTNSYEELTPNTPLEPQKPAVQGKRTTGGIDKEGYPTFFRYANVIGPAWGLASSFQPTDYSNADIIKNAGDAASRFTPLSYTPTGEKMKYTPLDYDYTSNMLKAQSRANARNIMASANLNPSAAMASLLANDYNTQTALGDAYNKSVATNAEMQKAVKDFNRSTDLANQNAAATVGRANLAAQQAAGATRLKAYSDAANMINNIDMANSLVKGQNISQIFNNISGIGRENMVFNMVNSDKSKYYTIDLNGNLKFKSSAYGKDGSLKPEVIDEIMKQAKEGKR